MKNPTRTITIGFSILMITILGICCISVQACATAPDAVIILADYTPPEIYLRPIETKPEPISNLEILQNFLISDTTNQKEYIPSGDDMYICVHFATDLAQNLTDSGHNAGIVVRSAKWHNKGCGHLLTWTEIGDELFVIESINDWVWISDDYNATIDTEIYVSRYESIDSGRRKCAEMYKRR